MQWIFADSMSVSWRNWIKRLRENSEERTCWESKQEMNNCTWREKGGRGMKSLRDTYKETRLRVACYMTKSTSRWIEAAWRREAIKEENKIVVKSVKMMEEVGVKLRFEGKSIRLGNEVIDEEIEWKSTWQKVKTCLQKAMESRRIKNYKTKERQSQFYQE